MVTASGLMIRSMLILGPEDSGARTCTCLHSEYILMTDVMLIDHIHAPPTPASNAQGAAPSHACQ